VPVKALSAAKQRLAPLLDGRERQRLARAMIEDVLDACASAPALAGIVVVTSDDEVAAISEQAGVLVLKEEGERGTNAAVQAGVRSVMDVACGIIVVPADVPHLTSDAVDAVAQLCGQKNALVLVRARRDGGTNLLACTPPELIEPSFGSGSFARHRDLARQAGIEPILPSFGHLDLDLDQPEDIDRFLALPATTRTHRVLLDLCVPARLRPALGASPAVARVAL
jgi:2-phospho-L-lactate guanylyltransferase